MKKILVANRGEIAVRIMKTCMEMGISTVAVFSGADKKAAHRFFADESIFIGESDPSKSYLNMEKIIDAAKKTKSWAIHPGYGFLAENSGFAARCEEEGIVFIGPPARVIQDLGDKTVARKIMQKSGIPVIPGMTESEDDGEAMAEFARKTGYPLLVKAAAGGGGKGMRVVEKEADLAGACESASREALQAFGNGAIYLEKYLSQPRHVEVQILADSKGNVIHLFERECSIQRRHQKIIEESPCPGIDPALRDKMGKAAISAVKAAGYINAGTVEFLLDQDKKFYFLEVNTRLQVEHPVTEMITGIDLVRKQIEIAEGLPLGLIQEDIIAGGHSVECRIYGEDPENDFFPSPGKILHMKEPSGPGIRNDCGVYSGYTVPVEYDPIISKLVVHARTRELAVEKMVKALSDYVILGIKTPIPLLMDIVKSEPFKKGNTHTWFLEEHFSNWKPEYPEKDLACLAFICHELSARETDQGAGSEFTEQRSPWNTLGRWRI